MTLRAQKRKRSQPGISPAVRTDGAGRARSKFTGVYQQSRGHGWFASICVDKSVWHALVSSTAVMLICV